MEHSTSNAQAQTSSTTQAAPLRMVLSQRPAATPHYHLVKQQNTTLPQDQGISNEQAELGIAVVLNSTANHDEHTTATTTTGPDQTSIQQPTPDTNNESPTLLSRSGRGRPKGWKPGMSYAAMRGQKSPKYRASGMASRNSTWQGSESKPVSGKRRGRPPKPPSPEPIELFHRLKPSYVAFLCEWAGCKAELHNLETLRRHIRIVHGEKQRQLCRWGKCNAQITIFSDSEEWLRHLESVHLVPLSWHVGDGPTNTTDTPVGPNIPHFLLDELGHQVTPSVKDQQVEDLETSKIRRRKLKALLKRRDENMQSDSEDQMDHFGMTS